MGKTNSSLHYAPTSKGFNVNDEEEEEKPRGNVGKEGLESLKLNFPPTTATTTTQGDILIFETGSEFGGSVTNGDGENGGIGEEEVGSHGGSDDESSEDEDDGLLDGIDDMKDDDNTNSTGASSRYSGLSEQEIAIRKMFATNQRNVATVLFVYLAFFTSLFVYVVTRRTEVNNFENEFHSLADNVYDKLQDILTSQLHVLDSLSIEATSHATTYNSSWPFVTINDFTTKAKRVLPLSNLFLISFNPLVTLENRQAWEQYTVDHTMDWLWQDADSSIGQEEEVSIGATEQYRASSSPATTTTSVAVAAKEEEVETDLGFSKQIYKINEDYHSNSTTTNTANTSTTTASSSSSSSSIAVKEEEQFIYFPSWQSYPISPAAINYNVYNPNLHHYEAIREILLKWQSSKEGYYDTNNNNNNEDNKVVDGGNDGGTYYKYAAVLSREATVEQPEDYKDGEHDDGSSSSTLSAQDQYLVNTYTYYLKKHLNDPNATYNGEPVSTLFYPVFDSFDANNKEGHRELVGLVTASIYWHTILKTLVPSVSEAHGVYGVLQNSCGDSSTYEIHGEGADYLGHGDLHDKSFEYLEFSIDIASLHIDNGSLRTSKSSRASSTTTILPLDEEYCPHTLRLYPSHKLHDFYVTWTPMIFALSLVAFFGLLGLVSSSYDVITQRRMTRTLKSEQQARALIEEHFPDEFHDRIFAVKREANERKKNETRQQQQQQATSSSVASMTLNPKHQLATYFDDEIRDELPSLALPDATPLADLYLRCTIIFVNLVGFNAWSSQREPEQVFILLENIFQAFDGLAKRRNVFKVRVLLY